ncbi:hypothetical protein GGP94_002960 [Salinibacter ruber]|nr:hypothetical protein [Salinibacter ruber]
MRRFTVSAFEDTYFTAPLGDEPVWLLETGISVR